MIRIALLVLVIGMLVAGCGVLGNRVEGSDPHRFDGDADGIGCES